MDFFETVKKRCSVREYSDKPVKKEDLEEIIDYARLAPTARKEEPWEFVTENVLLAAASLGIGS